MIIPRVPKVTRAPARAAPAPAAKNLASTPRGGSPNSALEIKGTWETLAPGASVWYKTDYSDNFRILELWVDSPVQNGLGLSIYSPDQAEGLAADIKPVGRGTFNKSIPEHVLSWKAGLARSGIWYALVSNYTASPVPYRLTINQATAGARDCISYWEYLPDGRYVLWTDCGHYHKTP